MCHSLLAWLNLDHQRCLVIPNKISILFYGKAPPVATNFQFVETIDSSLEIDVWFHKAEHMSLPPGLVES